MERALVRKLLASYGILALVALAASCASRATLPPPREHAALLASALVFDGSGGRSDFAALAAAAASAEFVFVGESPDDESTHAFELALYERLLALTGGKTVLALEMFSRDVQQALDAYLAGDEDEAWLLDRARPWPNYHTDYRPLIEAARARKLPVIASNAPAALARKIAGGGSAAYAALGADERAFVASELHPHGAAYWERFDRAVRAHAPGTGGTSGASGADAAASDARLYSVQSLWDNTMAESCLRARDQNPGCVVLHVNGGFHSDARDGTVRQLLLRREGARVVTVAVEPVEDLAAAEAPSAPARADFVVYVPRRARSLAEGTYAVRVGRELRYRLHVPAAGASRGPLPLLIWLGDAGTRAGDALALWRYLLGDHAAIAVVEPPYTEIAEQLHVAGRWYWPATFFDDLDALHDGIDALGEYAAARFPIDRARVVLAGEGAGATVVAAHALFREGVWGARLAFDPRAFA